MPCKIHISLFFFLSIGMLFLFPSCSDDDVNLNPSMEKASLSDEIPYGEMGSGKLLFTRGHTSYLIDMDDHSVSELIIDPVGAPLLSPEGEIIAYASYEEKLHLWNIVEKDQKTRPLVGVDFNMLSWTPDSKSLYYSTSYTNKLYALNISDNTYSRTFIRAFPEDILFLSAFSVSAEGDLATYISASFFVTTSQTAEEFAFDGLYVMNPEGKECTCISKHSGDPSLYSHSSPQWAPDGQTLAYLSITNQESNSLQELILIDKDGSNARVVAEKEIPFANVPFAPWGVPPSNIRLSWSPDGSRIAFIGMEDEIESHIYIVHVLSRELVQVTSKAGVEDRSVSWSD